MLSKPTIHKEVSRRLRYAFVWLSITSAFSLSISMLILLVERGVNEKMDSVGETVWWWVVTVTGLGYGDRYPITNEGKVLGSIVILTSLVLLAIVISEVAGLIRLTYERRERGRISIHYKDHIVVYGYSSLTAGVVKLLRSHFGKELKIVLISNDVEFNPFPNDVDFIYANPIDKYTFEEANAVDALASIILVNDRFTDPDAYSIVIAVGVEMYNPKAITIVEIMDDDYKSLYKEGKIEAFIKRKDLLSDLLTKSEDSKLIRIIEKETTLSSEAEQNDEEVEVI